MDDRGAARESPAGRPRQCRRARAAEGRPRSRSACRNERPSRGRSSHKRRARGPGRREARARRSRARSAHRTARARHGWRGSRDRRARSNGSTACNSQPSSSATSAAIWSAPSAIGETKRRRGGASAKQSPRRACEPGAGFARPARAHRGRGRAGVRQLPARSISARWPVTPTHKVKVGAAGRAGRLRSGPAPIHDQPHEQDAQYRSHSGRGEREDSRIISDATTAAVSDYGIDLAAVAKGQAIMQIQALPDVLVVYDQGVIAVDQDRRSKPSLWCDDGRIRLGSRLDPDGASSFPETLPAGFCRVNIEDDRATSCACWKKNFRERARSDALRIAHIPLPGRVCVRLQFNHMNLHVASPPI